MKLFFIFNVFLSTVRQSSGLQCYTGALFTKDGTDITDSPLTLTPCQGELTEAGNCITAVGSYKLGNSSCQLRKLLLIEYLIKNMK